LARLLAPSSRFPLLMRFRVWGVENSGDDFTRTVNGQKVDIHIDNPAEELNFRKLTICHCSRAQESVANIVSPQLVIRASQTRTGTATQPASLSGSPPSSETQPSQSASSLLFRQTHLSMTPRACRSLFPQDSASRRTARQSMVNSTRASRTCMCHSMGRGIVSPRRGTRSFRSRSRRLRAGRMTQSRRRARIRGIVTSFGARTLVAVPARHVSAQAVSSGMILSRGFTLLVIVRKERCISCIRRRYLESRLRFDT
jgi:hypothetical protein